MWLWSEQEKFTENSRKRSSSWFICRGSSFCISRDLLCATIVYFETLIVASATDSLRKGWNENICHLQDKGMCCFFLLMCPNSARFLIQTDRFPPLPYEKRMWDNLIVELLRSAARREEQHAVFSAQRMLLPHFLSLTRVLLSGMILESRASPAKREREKMMGKQLWKSHGWRCVLINFVSGLKLVVPDTTCCAADLCQCSIMVTSEKFIWVLSLGSEIVFLRILRKTETIQIHFSDLALISFHTKSSLKSGL